jgi:hypothetical protein
MKQVPQTDQKQFEFDFHAVRLEPELQMQAATYTPHQRRVLACVYERWAHQLRVSARLLEKHRLKPRRDPLRPLPARLLVKN